MLSYLSKTIKARMVANAVRKSATEVMIPPLTVFLSCKYGTPFAGLIITIMLVLGSIATLIGGKVANNHDIKKILTMCEIFHIFSLVGMLIYIHHSKFIFIFFYLMKNIFFSLSLPAGETIFFTELSKSKRKEAYIADNLLSCLVMSIFSMVGFFFFKKEIYIVVLISTVLSVLYFFLTVVFCPKGNKTKPITYSISYIEHLKDSKFFMISVSSIVTFSVGLLFNNYFAVKVSGTQGKILSFVVDGPIFFSFLRITSIIVPLLFLTLTKKTLFSIKDEELYKYQALWSISIFALYNLNVYWLMIITVCLSFFLESILLPCRQSIIVNSISENHSGTYMAAISLYKRIGNILSVSIFSFSSSLNKIAWDMILLILLGCGVWLMYAATRLPQNNATKNRDALQ